MANRLYDPFVNSYLTQAANQVDLDADDIRAICVDAADYTVDTVNHDFLNDIPAAARVAVSGPLANKTVTGRVFDVSGRMLSVSEGWHRGPTIEMPADDPVAIAEDVKRIVREARPNANMFGYDEE